MHNMSYQTCNNHPLLLENSNTVNHHQVWIARQCTQQRQGTPGSLFSGDKRDSMRHKQSSITITDNILCRPNGHYSILETPRETCSKRVKFSGKIGNRSSTTDPGKEKLSYCHFSHQQSVQKVVRGLEGQVDSRVSFKATKA